MLEPGSRKVAIGYPCAAVRATTNQARQKALVGYATLFFLAMGLATEVAVAAESMNAASWISGDTACPAPMAVEAEVSRLTSSEGRTQHLPGASVRVFDSGESYQIEITKGGDHFEKTYVDPARECDKRVRVAAVYVIMALFPPEFAMPDATPSEAAAPPSTAESDSGAMEEPAVHSAPVPKPRPVKEPAPVRRARPAPARSVTSAETPSWWRIDAALIAQHSISNSQVPKVGALGGDLLAMIGAGEFTWVFGVDATTKSHFDIGQVRVETAELACRTGVRLSYGEHPLRLGADAGVIGAVRRLQGEAAETSEGQTTNELGAFVGASAALGGWSWASPIVGLQVRLFPSPAELVVTPRGQIGTMPKIWLGVLAGVRLAP
jgi:hypothetical protein